MSVKMLEPDFVFSNEAGRLVQLVHDGWKQVNVLYSNAGTERGGHCHKKNLEAFYVVSGELELLLESDNGEERFKFSRGDFFMVLSHQRHSLRFIADTVMVAMYDKGVELPDGTKDIHSD